ncbi:MAG: hypothetical protein ACTSXU_13160, partial [Promethearchaeota archaeon]
MEKELSKLLKDKDEDIETAIANVESEKKRVLSEIEKVKLELKKETQKQKKYEIELNQLRKEISRKEKHVSDLKGKISVARSQQEIWDKEIHKINRDLKNIEINKIKFEEEIQRLIADQEKIVQQITVKEKLLDDLKQERKIISEKLKSSQEEYEGVEEEIFGIMTTLQMFVENYQDSLTELKAEIQEGGINAVDDSMDDFKSYVSDLMELISLIKDVGKN